jgi:hypothetical protein
MVSYSDHHCRVKGAERKVGNVGSDKGQVIGDKPECGRRPRRQAPFDFAQGRLCGWGFSLWSPRREDVADPP